MSSQEEFDLFGAPAKAAPARADDRPKPVSQPQREKKQTPPRPQLPADPAPASGASSPVANPHTAEPRPLSVAELTRCIRELLEGGLGEVWVAGEISNLRRQASGHQYFTLKDASAQLACVLFRGASARSGSTVLADGLQVEVKGDLTVYEARGQYQVIVRSIAELGRGRLHEQFEALKRKLEAEGLFDPARKRSLPAFPRRIALVTSPTGAAIRDMLDVLGRRAPWIEVVVAPVRVQGAGAAAEIAKMLARLDSWASSGALPLDVVIVGRGGGSLEDLWAFNEEVVARAIAACSLPVVSAVGHETDFTIADFVADVRAPTPSAAAEIVSPSGDELRHRLAQLRRALDSHILGRLRIARLQLDGLQASGLHRETLRRLSDTALTLDDMSERLQLVVRGTLDHRHQVLDRLRERLRHLNPLSQLRLRRSELTLLDQRLKSSTCQFLESKRSLLDRLAAQLRLLGPQSTLERGYTLTFDDQGRILTSALTVPKNARLRTRFKDGEVTSQIISLQA